MMQPEAKDHSPRFVFIGGSPRSGTTLVQRMIAAHPDVYGGPEFDVIPQVVALWRALVEKIKSGRISNILDRDHADASIRHLIEGLFVPKLEVEGARVLSEKTPANVLVIRELLEFMPEARFIFVMRDPRDIYASMKEVRQKALATGAPVPAFTKNPVAGAQLIREYWDKGREALRSSDRVLPLFYEDAVRYPEKEAARICQFLDLPFIEGMTRIEQAKFEYANPETFRNWYSEEQITKAIDQSSIGRHEEMLSSSERAIIEHLIPNDPLWERYELGRPSLPPSARIARLAAEVRPATKAWLRPAYRKLLG